MQHKNPLVSAILAAWLCWLAPASHAAGSFDQGMRYYHAGLFDEAARLFSRAVWETPDDAMVHYYLANALVKLKLHEQAMREYELCYRVDPYGTVAGYCVQAMKAYGMPIPDVRQPPIVSAASGETVRSAAAGAQHVVHKTKSLIRRQAELEKEKHEQAGEDLARAAIRQAEQDSQRIQEEAAMDIESVLTPPSVLLSPRGGSRGRLVPFDPVAAKARADEIRREAEENVRRARMLARVRAGQYRQWSQERKYVLDEVVANLESQLDTPGGTSGVRLQPVGTDLYVRYYGWSHGSRAQPPEVRPAVVRIIGERANERSLGEVTPPPRPIIRKIVRGKILP